MTVSPPPLPRDDPGAGRAVGAAAQGFSVQVFAADDIYVRAGVNTDDGMGAAEEVEIGDVYALDPAAQPMRLKLSHTTEGPLVAEGSGIGNPGAVIHSLAQHMLMGADGDRVTLLLLELAGQRYVLPLSPMACGADYTLLTTAAAPETPLLADLMCLSFARGTRITLASGQQASIESLQPGDRVLTRDHGAQELRFIGRATLRSLGSFAPVVIPAGILGNAGDLIVSQHHRMFLYQRQRRADLTTSELLVQARHLVDGEQVFIREGGYTDWFSLVFDRHEIIYAEGIPAESLMVNDATISRLPADIAAEVRARFPGLAQVQHFGTEAGRAFLERLGPNALGLRGAPRR